MFNLTEVITSIIVLTFAVVFHEVAHGWVANKLGDPTAKQLGRLTLNPISHIDPFGTIILPILLKVMHAPFILGWAKPVPVNFSNLHNPKQDMIWVALAGPFVNIVLAVIASFLLKLHIVPALNYFFATVIVLNLILAIFNLIPIPPLDGSRILTGLLPNRIALPYSRLEPYGMIILLILLYLGALDFIGIIVFMVAIFLGVDINAYFGH